MTSLTSGSNNQSYAISASSDGTISFSLSNSHGTSRMQWIRSIFDNLSKQLNISFTETAYGDAELNFKAIPITKDEYVNSPGGEPSLIKINQPGSIEWKSAKDTRQYGGVQDQLTATRAVLRSLGLSYPDGSPWNSNILHTIMSSIKTEKGLYGHTFYATENDINALQSIHGVRPQSELQLHQHHYSDVEESLLVGTNGVRDYFYLTRKGINSSNQASITYDQFGPIYNDYENHSIANFNVNDGDKIWIDRRLFSPYDSDSFATDEWLKNEGRNLEISFIFSSDPSSEGEIRQTIHNVIYNDAGKLMLNVNGNAPDLGPEYGVNNYLALLLTLAGQGDWKFHQQIFSSFRFKPNRYF